MKNKREQTEKQKISGLQKILLLHILLLLITGTALSGTIYVNGSATGTNDGSSWANAYTSFQSALNAAVSGDQIWVAKGTYKPSYDYGLNIPAPNTARGYHFRMVPGVEIYGGFAGTETDVSQRTDFSRGGVNETILSGDLNEDDVLTGSGATLTISNNEENCFHVFYHPSGLGLTNNAILDGFTVSGGNANNSSHTVGGGMANYGNHPTINSTVFTGNSASGAGGAIKNGISGGSLPGASPVFNNCMILLNLTLGPGGGISNDHVSAPKLTNCNIIGNKAGSGGGVYSNYYCPDEYTNCFFTGNHATGSGGAMFNNQYSWSKYINCVFANNTASSTGGGLYIALSRPASVTNCTFYENTAGTTGGGIHVQSLANILNIRNAILWGNTAGNGNQLYSNSATEIAFHHTCYSNSTGDIFTNGTFNVTNDNITDNPLLVDPNDEDYRLYALSPCVDAGDNSYNTTLTDIRGEDRIQNTTIDVGAYEWTSGLDPGVPIYVDASKTSGANNGSSWDDAYTSFQSALDVAVSGDQIWVAKGTYKPSYAYDLTNTSRYFHFRMKEGVEIYGGFAGTEILISQRTDFGMGGANETVLSGDIGTEGVNTDNCYHVFYHPSGLGLTNAAVLDGFTIRDGNANGSDPHNSGGCMYNYVNSPSLINCIVYNNRSNGGGAGIYNSSSSPDFTNCIIYLNTSLSNYGGGIYNINSSPIINNSTLYANSARRGGGICHWSGETFTINNSIIYGNYSGEGIGPDIYNSIIINLNYSNYGSIAGSVNHNNNSTSNPRFINPNAGDFRIFGSSPCVDTGNDAYCEEAYDIRGIGYNRKLDKDDAGLTGTIDRGAFEYNENSDPYATIIYVDATATGNNDGTSWTDAFVSFQDALNTAAPGYQIWVAKGTYKPSSSYDLPNTSRYYHFRMIEGVELYGGFAGTETSVSQRTDFGNGETNEAILSADIGTEGVNTDNCYHVFYHPSGLGLTSVAVLDGFTIRDGNANGSNPHSLGGGVYNASNSPLIRNCILRNNVSSFYGAAIYNTAASPLITNCIIYQNTSSSYGGGIYNTSSSPILTNTTLYGNSGSQGGGVYHNIGTLTVNNSIVFGNTAGTGPDIRNNSGTVIMNYSNYGSISGIINHNNNITSYPLFVNSNAGDFRIFGSSPCVDAGNDAYCDENYDIRGTGFARKILGTDYTQPGSIDIGAFEYNSNEDPTCINPSNGGTISASQTICYNNNPVVFTSTASPTGHTGTLEYKWQSSTISNSNGFSDIASSNSEVYDPPALTQTTWYKRMARVNCQPDWTGAAESNVLEITVRSQFTPGTIATTGETICYNADPGVIGSTTIASGGDESIEYKWQISPDGSAWSDIASSNSATYDPSNLTTTTHYRRLAKDGTCSGFTASTGDWIVTVRAQFTPGAIATTGETICYAGTPAEIGSTTAASGGDGTITYSWRSSADNYTEAINGATSATYTPTAGLQSPTTYRRYAKDGTCNTTPGQSTGEWTVMVRSQFTPGAIATIGETICYNADPSVIGSATAATGGDNVIEYKWQSSPDGSDWSDIASSNSATYDPSNLTTTTHYQRLAKDGTCNSFTASTGVWVVTVRSQFSPGAIATTGETICYGGTPAEIGSTIAASGGDGTISYSWRSSTDNYVNAINGATSATYTPPAGLQSTTTYRRYANDGTCNTTPEQSTGEWTVTVRSQFTPGAIATTGETICYSGTPIEIGSTIAASGGDGTITYSWRSSADNYVDAINGATSATYTPPAGLQSTTTYRRYAKDGTCNTTPGQSTGEWTVMVRSQFTPGAIATNGETICYAGTPSEIGSTTAASGGDGTITYTWRSSADNYTEAINGATSATYTPPAGLQTTTTYRRYAKDGICNTTPEQSTGEWTVTVRSQFTAGAIAANGETICYNADPVVIGSNTPASGGDEAIEYKWQSSPDGSDWSDIASSNSATYDPTNLTATTHYQRLAKDGTCNGFTASTGVWVVTVYDDFTPGTISNTGETICYNADPAVIGSNTPASGGDEAIEYKWQSSPDGLVWSDIASSNTATYDPTNLTVTTHYQRLAKDGTCNGFTASTGVWVVTVYDDFTPGTISNTGETNCYNADPAIIGSVIPASGGDEAIEYKWQSSPDGSDWSDIASSNSVTYNPTNLTATTHFQRLAKDGTCNSFTPSTGVWIVKVYDDFTPGTISNTGETICYNDDPAVIGSTTPASGGDEAIEYKWQSSPDGSDWTDIPSSNSATYNPSNLTATTHYQRLAKDGTCSSFTASTGVWIVTVYDDFTPGTISNTGETICYNTDPAIIGSVIPASGGDEAIEYKWQSSPDGSDWSDIASSNSVTYDPTNLTATTHYQRLAKDGTCSSFTASTGVWVVTVRSQFTPGAIATNGETICYGGNPSAIGSNLSWNTVGTSGFSAGNQYSPSLALDGSGIPYVVYRDGGNNNKATVMKFDDDNWVTVGTAGFSAGSVYYTSLALDGSGIPYVAYRDVGNNNKATVMKFDGDNWVTVGTAGFSAGNADFSSLALDGSGIPYLAYSDGGNSYKATVMKFDGDNWVTVGTVGFSAGYADSPSLALDGSGIPYLAYRDGGNSNKATVMKFDGDNWVTVGTAGFSAGSAYYTSLALDGSGIPYVAYWDWGINAKANVMKFDGDNWVTVGTAGFSAGSAYYTSLALDGSGIPYVAYQDGGNNNKATVMKFDGDNWVTVGTAGFSAGIAYYTSLALDGSGIPYVAYQDGENNNKATVMKSLNGNASGGDEAIEYKWQSSPDGSDWSDIASSNSATYDPANLTVTTHYQRLAKDGTCSNFTASTGVWVVTVYDEFTPGTISNTGETICYNADPAVIGSNTPASGGDEAIEYKWQSSPDGSDWSDIASSNSATYDPANLTVTTHYQRLAKDGTCNSFTPSTGVWIVTVYDDFTPGTISNTGETICYNADPAVIGSNTPASGGDEAIEYKWQSSPDGLDWSDIASSNSVTYDPANLTVTTHYQRLAKDGTCSSFTASTGVWIVTVYDDFTPGTISNTGETICYNADPAVIGSTTPASGGDEAIEYKWQSSPDGSDWSDIASSNSATYDPANLTATTHYQRLAKDGTCNGFTASTGVWIVTVYDDFTPGTISNTGETICYNADPAVIGSTTPASGGDEAFEYKWQSSPDGSDWSDIASSNAATYDPTNLTATTHFQRLAKVGTCNGFTASTGVWVVTVYDDFTPGTISNTGETICYNADPAVIGSTTPASGGDEAIEYKWQSSPDGSDWSDIASSNSATYDPANLTATTHFQRLAKDGTCNSFTPSTGVWIVKVYDDFTPGTISNTGETICYNDVPAVIGSNTPASGGDEAIEYKWQSSSDGSDWSDIASSNSATYNPSNLTVTTHYQRLAKDGTCNSFTASTGVWIVKVYDDFTPGTISNTGETICYNADPAIIGSVIPASGGDEAIEYKWQSSPDGSDWSDIASSNSVTYDPSNLTATTHYQRLAKDGTCSSFTASTGVWVVTVYDEFTPGTISNTGETICYNTDPAIIGSVIPASGGDEAIEYKWQSSSDGSDWSDIASSNSVTYDPANLTVTTHYQRLAKDGTCSSFTASTGVWVVTVYDEFTPGTISTTGETICYNDDPNQIGSLTPASGGDEAIEYKWQSSPDGLDWSDIASSNSATYDPANLTATTHYQRLAKDGTCNSFTPSTGVWIVTVYDDFTPGTFSNTGETICYNADPAIIGSVIPASGGDEAIEYKWQSSPEGSDWSDIASSNSATYDPTNLTATTHYQRLAKDGTCNSFTASTGVWIVKVYDDFTPGTISNTGETICYNADPAVIGSNTPASGGDEAIEYKWQSSPDGSDWSDIASSNSATYDPSNLTTTTHYRRLAKDGTCSSFTASTGVWVVTVYDDFTPGTISNTGETICYNADPAVIGSTTPASGGDEAIEYKWQSSPDGSDWSDIASSNSATYDPSNLTTTTHYQRLTKDGTCSSFTASTGVWIVTVYDDFTPGTISNTGETICYNADPAVIGSTTPASGGDEAIEYKWQSSPDGSDWSDIASSNAATYDPTNLTAATHFQRLAKDGTCNSFTPSTGVWIVTVYDDFTPGTISNTGETICYNADPAIIGSVIPASGGDEAIEYKWQSSPDGLDWSDIASSNSATYDPTNLTATTHFQRLAKDGTCNSFTPSTGVWIVKVYDDFTPGTISNTGETICYNDDPAVIGSTTPASGGDEAIEYKWQSSPDGLDWSDIASSNSVTYDPANLTATTHYQRLAKDGTCSSFTASTGVWVVTVYDEFTPGTISNTGETICYNTDPAVIGSNTPASGGDEAIEYKWQSSPDGSDWSDIASSNAATYDPTNLTAATHFQRLAKDGTCNGFTASTGVWVVTVYDDFTPGTISNTGETICYNTVASEIGSVTPAGGGDESITYAWRSSADSYTADIPGADAAAYTPGTLTQTTTFRRYAKDGTCNTDPEQSTGEWTVTIESYVMPEVTIAQTSGNNPCCPEDVVTFEATPVNGGANPSYQWYVNGTPAGTDDPVFNFDPDDGDQISVMMTTSILCPTVANATSNTITMQEINPATVMVSMRATKGTGREVIFTAYPVNSGANPVYKWYKNNVLVQEGSSPVLSSECTAGDEHYVELYSSLPCAVKATSLVYCSY